MGCKVSHLKLVRFGSFPKMRGRHFSNPKDSNPYYRGPRKGTPILGKTSLNDERRQKAQEEGEALQNVQVAMVLGHPKVQADCVAHKRLAAPQTLHSPKLTWKPI